ncbi:MAG: YeeE/YedE family protein [Gemmobacter sp.]
MLEPAWITGLVGGLMIGTAAALYLLANGRVMGASGIVGDTLDGTDTQGRPERLAFLAALVAVPVLIHLLVAPVLSHVTPNLGLVAVAGVLVGLGTRLANGCTSGHGVCGLSRLAPRGLAATAVFMASGVVTLALFRHAWGLI